VAIDCAGPGAILPFPSAALELGYAATDVLVCLYARDGLEHALASDPVTSREVYEGLAAALDRVERLAEARGQAKAEDRVARVISVVADTLSPPVRRDHLPAGLQQRDLARLAGVRHESFCRILGKLEKAGTIARHEGALRIEHHEALAASAG
jgi:CRP-like cAMP-binding protein